MPDSRDVPPKNGAGLYRAGVAELIRHIIRIGTMSTKMQGLQVLTVDVGGLETTPVPHV